MLSLSKKSIIGLLAALAIANAQDGVPGDQTNERNLTPDYFWHNRYFAMLGMSSYGDYDSTCPTQSFTEANKLKNFPESTLPPWEVIETWSTASGCHGYSAVVPEMNKVLMVFRGNYQLEQNLDQAVVDWSEFGFNGSCSGCTANAFAVQGYNEAKLATNNWEATRNRYYGAGLVFAITGHGLGGMHALIASVDYNAARICYYSHNHGTPRTFNPAGARWYNSNFNGEAGERAIWNNDRFGELIPASENYAHAGTTFYYWGFDQSTGQPNVQICWESPEDPLCQPRDQGNGLSSAQSHYFYFANVGQCGGSTTPNLQVINQYISTGSVGGSQPYASPNGGGARTTTSRTTYYNMQTRTAYTTYYPPTSTDYDYDYEPTTTTSQRRGGVPARYTSSSRGY